MAIAGLAVAGLAGCENGDGTPPTIVSAAPATATEDVAYVYQAIVRDPDGPHATWRLAPGHTCGGAIDPATGALTFTPTGPVPAAACVVAIDVCDGSESNWCASQTAAVTIVAVDDAPVIDSEPPPGAFEDVAYVYAATATDPDGPSLTWSLSPAHTCGGAIDAATGRFEVTLGPAPGPSCVLAIQVCDGAGPAGCATQTTTVNVVESNDAPTIDSVAPTTVAEGVTYTYAATATDPDGPAATWTTQHPNSCGAAIDPVTGLVTFTVAGPAPLPVCDFTIAVCDGGVLERCTHQTTLVNVEPDDDPPTGIDDIAPCFRPAAPLTIDVLANDLDADGGPRSVARDSSAMAPRRAGRRRRRS